MLKALIISLFITVVSMGQASDNIAKPTTMSEVMLSPKVWQPSGYELVGLVYPQLDTLAFISFFGGRTLDDSFPLNTKAAPQTLFADTIGVDSTSAGYIDLQSASVQPLNYFWLALPDSMPAARAATFQWIFRLRK